MSNWLFSRELRVASIWVYGNLPVPVRGVDVRGLKGAVPVFSLLLLLLLLLLTLGSAVGYYFSVVLSIFLGRMHALRTTDDTKRGLGWAIRVQGTN